MGGCSLIYQKTNASRNNGVQKIGKGTILSGKDCKMLNASRNVFNKLFTFLVIGILMGGVAGSKICNNPKSSINDVASAVEPKRSDMYKEIQAQIKCLDLNVDAANLLLAMKTQSANKHLEIETDKRHGSVTQSHRASILYGGVNPKKSDIDTGPRLDLNSVLYDAFEGTEFGAHKLNIVIMISFSWQNILSTCIKKRIRFWC